MIRTYLADITHLLTKEVYEKYYREAPKWRQKKADSMRFQQNKAQSIGAWSLLEYARRKTGAGEENVYNLSHSGDYVLCSLDDAGKTEAVGCDIETVKDLRLKVAKRFFCESEYKLLTEMDDESGQRELFYRFWVLKESFMKATRQGMKMPLDSFEIGFDKNGEAFLVRQPVEFSRTYYYKEYKAAGVNSKIAVCTTGQAAEDIEIVKF